MAYPAHDLNFPPQTPAEERLSDWTAVFNCIGRPDAYFEKSLALLRSIKTRHSEVIDKLNLYLKHAKGELLRSEISHEIAKREALVKQEQPQPQQSKQKERKRKQ